MSKPPADNHLEEVIQAFAKEIELMRPALERWKAWRPTVMSAWAVIEAHRQSPAEADRQYAETTLDNWGLEMADTILRLKPPAKQQGRPLGSGAFTIEEAKEHIRRVDAGERIRTVAREILGRRFTHDVAKAKAKEFKEFSDRVRGNEMGGKTQA